MYILKKYLLYHIPQYWKMLYIHRVVQNYLVFMDDGQATILLPTQNDHTISCPVILKSEIYCITKFTMIPLKLCMTLELVLL